MNNAIETIVELMNVQPTNRMRLSEIIRNINAEDIAESFEELSREKVVQVYRMLPKDKAVEVFACLENDNQKIIIDALTDGEAGKIIEELFVDDAVDFIEEMPANVVKRVLKNVSDDKRKTINQLLQYPEDSAGAIMTTEFVDLKEDMTVSSAFKVIRTTGVDKETIYTCYVIRADRVLVGVVSARTLLLADPADRIGNIMYSNVISAHTTDDQEVIADMFKKYDLLSLPVVDSENRLVGIVTVDDILDIIEEENTEDFEIMGAMLPSEKPYLKTSVFNLYRNRIGWLMFLMIAGMGTGFILQGFEDAFLAVPMLVTFIPMMMDTGGNSGAQSSTMIIRGLALGEVTTADYFKIAWKEIRVSSLIGLSLAAVALLRVFLINMGEPDLLLKGSVVSLTLIFTVFMAKLSGCTLPMLAKIIKVDPAVMASPMITTIVDATSLLVFFAIARAMLGI